MQYLEAKIPIPEGYVIISQVDYEELKKLMILVDG